MQRPKVAHSPRPCSHSHLLSSTGIALRHTLGFSIRKMRWNIWQSACKTGEVIVYKLSVVYLSLFIRLSDYFNCCAIYFWKLDFHPPNLVQKIGPPLPFSKLKTSGRGCLPPSRVRGPFLERHGNFLGPKANFIIKTCWILAQFLALKPVQIVSITDSSIVLFSKFLKLWSWMQTQNSSPGLKSYRDFGETGPRSC